MDPDAALNLLIEALTEGDTAAAAEHFAALSEWIQRGGFPPRDPRKS
jgi:hypothetical protein